MEEKTELMKQVAHQTIVMQYILELAKTMKVPPIACVGSFFDKIQVCDDKYMQGFNNELDAFIGRITRRAKEKTDKLVAEYEAEERQKRLGPGGLDPQEVYEELPEELQQCFDSKDIQMLQDVLVSMEPRQAEMWLKKCIDSGLWVPGANDSGAGEGSEEGVATVEEGTTESCNKELSPPSQDNSTQQQQDTNSTPEGSEDAPPVNTGEGKEEGTDNSNCVIS